MDQVYRRQRHIYDLTRKYYLLGRDRLVRELGARAGESIVEIGCGTARNLIQIAKTYPDVRLFGLDASHEMLISAREAVERADLSERIVLVHGLAEDMKPSLFGRSEAFDHAIFSYSLSMIPDWRAALDAACRSTKAGGRIHIADFGDLQDLWPWAAKALRLWLGLFHVTPRSELLGVLEMSKGVSENRVLHILPGRYAFVLKAIPNALCGIYPDPVAPRPQ